MPLMTNPEISQKDVTFQENKSMANKMGSQKEVIEIRDDED